jgi:hypothetical protein
VHGVDRSQKASVLSLGSPKQAYSQSTFSRQSQPCGHDGQLCVGHIPTLGQDNSVSKQQSPAKLKAPPGAVQDIPGGMQHRPVLVKSRTGLPFALRQLASEQSLVNEQGAFAEQVWPKLPTVHSLPRQLMPPQELPQDPQLFGSTLRSVQLPLQQVSPVPQQVVVEPVPQTRGPVGQHAPATTVNPLSQAVARHFPPTQATSVACCTALGSQCLEQPPQFCGSLLVSVQSAVPPGSGQQSGVEPGQVVSQSPQCWGSMSRSTQLPSQHCGDPRVPSLQETALSHVVPQC